MRAVKAEPESVNTNAEGTSLLRTLGQYILNHNNAGIIKAVSEVIDCLALEILTFSVFQHLHVEVSSNNRAKNLERKVNMAGS